MLSLVFGAALAALLVALFLAKRVLAGSTGTDAMRRISDAIKSGAEAYLSRQNRTIGMLAVFVAVAIYLVYHGQGGVNASRTALWTTISFVLGAGCSVIAGYSGMWISIRANIRTAAAAEKGLNAGLQMALRAGAVSGFIVMAMNLIGIGGLYSVLTKVVGIDGKDVPLYIVGYGFGASFVALFAQLGGGIYTKAADVGADLVGKVEAGIPEDDPRNPAVIADLVGDNVGDCAGRGADIFESTAAETIGVMILAGSPVLYGAFGINGILFPLVVIALGLLCSVVGVFTVSVKEGGDPMSGLNRGFYVTAALAMVAFWFATAKLLHVDAAPQASRYYFYCGLLGLATSLAFVYITQYYTESKYRPVKAIADASKTGPATTIIEGLAVGMECTAIPVVVMVCAIVGSYFLGKASGIEPGHIGPLAISGLFGTAVATLGMLGPAGYIMAMDVFGPIADNAGGIVEMGECGEDIRKSTDVLDAVGNTTKALTKGYAIGTAALAAFLLFSAFMDAVSQRTGHAFDSVNLAKPTVFAGALLGGMLVFLFSSFAIRAVGRAAFDVIEAVRKQFREKPGIMAGTELPDYAACVDIVTRGALRQMIAPGLLAVGMPILVGLAFRSFITAADPTAAAEGIAAFLMVATITGILMALLLNNAGGAWDNAKKYIETGVHGGKGSEAHKAAVVGDTVGDPFKDTAGPSLHVLIKLLATVTLVMAPLFL
ncbi:MAG TPA: sodium-translocating pyrophosphatase [Holophagaceae bacterium]|jgi:K(+)-stimulated pyrophosphate-energized sodium pump|nr:sodium-translocating pyrophosphatase [Holophagaceae bacterium]